MVQYHISLLFLFVSIKFYLKAAGILLTSLTEHYILLPLCTKIKVQNVRNYSKVRRNSFHTFFAITAFFHSRIA